MPSVAIHKKSMRQLGIASLITTVEVKYFQQLLFVLQFLQAFVGRYEHHAPYHVVLSARVIIIVNKFSGELFFQDNFCS